MQVERNDLNLLSSPLHSLLRACQARKRKSGVECKGRRGRLLQVQQDGGE